MTAIITPIIQNNNSIGMKKLSNPLKMQVQRQIGINIYESINKEETETTINVLYNEKIISVYSNKIELQKSSSNSLHLYQEFFICLIIFSFC